MADNRVPGIGKITAELYVCPVCGFTVASLSPSLCPRDGEEMHVRAKPMPEDLSKKMSVDERRAWIEAERRRRSIDGQVKDE